MRDAGLYSQTTQVCSTRNPKGRSMDSQILSEAIEAMAANGVTKMNAFITKYGGRSDVTVKTDDAGYPIQQGDAARMLGRDLLRAVAKLARERSGT